mmetsp:Transcript_38462/g.63968  ORF Transcript_38462/g.63968 Transcript_38462/m.63968 type:complete len:331 (-) Transcript_38462:157-1149(-)
MEGAVWRRHPRLGPEPPAQAGAQPRVQGRRGLLDDVGGLPHHLHGHRRRALLPVHLVCPQYGRPRLKEGEHREEHIHLQGLQARAGAGVQHGAGRPPDEREPPGAQERAAGGLQALALQAQAGAPRHGRPAGLPRREDQHRPRPRPLPVPLVRPAARPVQPRPPVPRRPEAGLLHPHLHAPRRGRHGLAVQHAAAEVEHGPGEGGRRERPGVRRPPRPRGRAPEGGGAGEPERRDGAGRAQDPGAGAVHHRLPGPAAVRRHPDERVQPGGRVQPRAAVGGPRPGGAAARHRGLPRGGERVQQEVDRAVQGLRHVADAAGRLQGHDGAGAA